MDSLFGIIILFKTYILTDWQIRTITYVKVLTGSKYVGSIAEFTQKLYCFVKDLNLWKKHWNYLERN